MGHSGVNMPVNANILAQFAQPVRSVNDYMADYERQDANKLAGQRNALMLQGAQADMADRERTRAESETIRNVLASLGGGATVEKQAQALRATGLPTALSQAAAFEKSALERRNIESQAAEREAKTNAEKYGLKRKQLEHGVQWLQVAQSPQQAAQMFTDGVRKGYWGMQDAQQQVATIPQDPAQFQQWKQQQLAQILDAEKQLPTLVAEDQGGSRLYGARNRFTGALTQNAAVPITQSANNAATVAATLAGQRSTAATAAAQLRQADAHFNAQQNAPTWDATNQVFVDRKGQTVKPGTLQDGQPMPGKTLNDSQSKSYLFGSRMQAADKIIADMAEKGVLRPSNMNAIAGATPLVGGIGDSATNWMNSNEQAQVKQAKLDFMTAALRRESGASIAPSEFDTFDKTYFPQIGDTPGQIKNKAALRQRAIDGVLIEVPSDKRPKVEQGKPKASVSNW